MPMRKNFFLNTERANTYKKEELEYIQFQINKIRNSVEDKQSQLAWHN